MEAQKALLKIRHDYQDLDWLDHYIVIEAIGKIFYVSSKREKVFLSPGDDINENQLKSVGSEEGAPVEIAAFDVFDEPTELFLKDDPDEEEGEGRKAILMLICETCRPNQLSLCKIDKKGETIQISPADFGDDIEETLEILRDCNGITFADFTGGYFVLEVDPRTPRGTILRDIEKWLGEENTIISVLTLEDYLGRFSHYPSFLLPPPNQLWLPGIQE